MTCVACSSGHHIHSGIVPLCLDPNFVVSSNRDHARESFKAQTGVERIVSWHVTSSRGGHSHMHRINS